MISDVQQLHRRIFLASSGNSGRSDVVNKSALSNAFSTVVSIGTDFGLENDVCYVGTRVILNRSH